MHTMITKKRWSGDGRPQKLRHCCWINVQFSTLL